MVKSLEITMKLTDDGQFKLELYEPESGDYSWWVGDVHTKADIDDMCTRVGDEFRWWAEEMANDLDEMKNIGALRLTLEQWRAAHPNVGYECVWAADTHAGFGKKGWTVYGNGYGLYIVRDTVKDNGTHVLHMWMDALGEMDKEVEA